jgi:hypothetical protein
VLHEYKEEMHESYGEALKPVRDRMLASQGPSPLQMEDSGASLEKPMKGRRKYRVKIPSRARCWWLKPVILATWETEIRRMTE